MRDSDEERIGNSGAQKRSQCYNLRPLELDQVCAFENPPWRMPGVEQPSPWPGNGAPRKGRLHVPQRFASTPAAWPSSAKQVNGRYIRTLAKRFPVDGSIDPEDPEFGELLEYAIVCQHILPSRVSDRGIRDILREARYRRGRPQTWNARENFGGHVSSLGHVSCRFGDLIITAYTAVVIAYKQPQLLKEVLHRLSSQTLLPRDVIVVDNGGTVLRSDIDGSALRDRISIIPRPDNPGYAAAVNEARGRCAEAVLVLTHDANFGDHLAEELISSLEADPSAGATAPILHWASEPDRIFSAGGYLTSGGRAGHLTQMRSLDPYAVDWADGAIVMYRRSALDAIDWLDERYFLYFEDVDTAWRMARIGYSTLIVPAAKAMQQPGAHPVYLGIRNMTLFARTASVTPLAQLGAVVRRLVEESAASVLRGRPPRVIDAWRGWRDGRHGRSGKPPSGAS
ncbi:glycosyltransferase family 2 protein [Microbacterium sp. OR16]|uniref:glycosyltransferase family 2 protein n=1 Tax=Microbacterium sp. OR16 TaxID=3095345 RepID=UPI0039B51211